MGYQASCITANIFNKPKWNCPGRLDHGTSGFLSWFEHHWLTCLQQYEAWLKSYWQFRHCVLPSPKSPISRREEQLGVALQVVSNRIPIFLEALLGCIKMIDHNIAAH